MKNRNELPNYKKIGVKVETDKILKIILFAAIFELMFKHGTPKKVIISEYLIASEHFLEKIQIGYLNAILDKISKELEQSFEQEKAEINKTKTESVKLIKNNPSWLVTSVKVGKNSQEFKLLFIEDKIENENYQNKAEFLLAIPKNPVFMVLI